MHKIKVFAGQGTKKPIRDVERLVKSYGGKPEDWMKVKEIGILSHRGEENKAEIHWYQANGAATQSISEFFAASISEKLIVLLPSLKLNVIVSLSSNR